MTMGGGRRDTVLGFQVEDTDLREAASLLAEISSYMSSLSSTGIGGFVAPGGGTSSTMGPPNGQPFAQPNNIPPSSSAYANTAPAGGLSPQAVGAGGTQGHAGTVIPPAGPAMTGGGGPVMITGAVISIQAAVVNVVGANVTVSAAPGAGGGMAGGGFGGGPAGPGGGGGGIPANGAPNVPGPSPGGGGGLPWAWGGGGTAPGGVSGAIGAISEMLPGIFGSTAAVTAANLYGTMQQQMYSGGALTQEQKTLQLFGALPFGVGGLINTVFGPGVERDAVNAMIQASAERQGRRIPMGGVDAGQGLSEPVPYGQFGPPGPPSAINGAVAPKPLDDTTIDYIAAMIGAGMQPSDRAIHYIENQPPGLKKRTSSALFRAASEAGKYGTPEEGAGGTLWGERPQTPREAAMFAYASGDIQTALDVGALGPQETHAMLSRASDVVRGGRRIDIATNVAQQAGAAERYYQMRGDFEGVSRAQLRMGQAAGDQRLEYQRIIADDMKALRSAQDLGDPDAIEAARKVLEQHRAAMADAAVREQELELAAVQTVYRGVGQEAGILTERAGIQEKRIVGTGGIYSAAWEGPQGPFGRERRGVGTTARVARAEYEFYRRRFGDDSLVTQQALADAEAAEAAQAELPFQQIETKYATLGGVQQAAGAQARGAAQIIIITGGGAREALPALIGAAQAAQVGVALAQSRLQEDITAGAGPAIVARDRAQVTAAQVGLVQTEAEMAQYTPPAAYNIEMRHAQNRLRRMQESWTEPGNMYDEYSTLYRGAMGRVRAIDDYTRRLEASGVPITPGMRDRLDSQREDAIMEAFQYRTQMERGWIDRLEARSIGAPSFYGRARPTNAEAAWQLEHGQTVEGFRQARDLGFVSRRGYDYERGRGQMTAGMGPGELFPGDIGLQTMMGGRPRTPSSTGGAGGASDNYIDRLLGLTGDKPEDGSASEDTLQQVVSELQAIRQALTGTAKGPSAGIPGSVGHGPTPLGHLPVELHQQSSAMGPTVGDTGAGKH